MNHITTELLAELDQERERQIEKGFTADRDDVMKNYENWCADIAAYNTWALQMARMGSPEKYRRRMRQIAAMAIAACESYDRVCSGSGEEDGPWAEGFEEGCGAIKELPTPEEMLHKYGPEVIHIFVTRLCAVAMADVDAAMADAKQTT